MMSPWFELTRPSLRRTVVTGSLASAAYLGAQALDRRVAPNEYDDLVLWGGFLSRRRRWQRALGLVVHFSLGITLAAVYESVRLPLPPMPGWFQGVLFAQVENALLYPGVPVLNAIHPEVRRGRLPSLLTWKYFLVEAFRHAAYGVVLGTLGRRRTVSAGARS